MHEKWMKKTSEKWMKTNEWNFRVKPMKMTNVRHHFDCKWKTLPVDECGSFLSPGFTEIRGMNLDSWMTVEWQLHSPKTQWQQTTSDPVNRQWKIHNRHWKMWCKTALMKFWMALEPDFGLNESVEWMQQPFCSCLQSHNSHFVSWVKFHSCMKFRLKISLLCGQNWPAKSQKRVCS